MATLYSAVLLEVPGLTPADGHAVYEVPAGKVVIVRQISAGSTPGIEASDLELATSATDCAFFYKGISIAAGTEVQQLDCRHVFNDVDGGFYATALHGTWDVRVSGYILDAP